MYDQSVEELSEALQNMFRTLGRSYTIFQGTILSSDKSNNTCTVRVGPDPGGIPFSAVPLEILLSGPTSLTSIPEDNSVCLLGFKDGNPDQPQILRVGRASKIIADPSQLFQFNKGQNGGIPLSPELTGKLNNIENLLNDFITLFNTHTHNVTAVGSPTGPSIEQETETLTPTEQSEIESKVITQ